MTYQSWYQRLRTRLSSWPASISMRRVASTCVGAAARDSKSALSVTAMYRKATRDSSHFRRPILIHSLPQSPCGVRSFNTRCPWALGKAHPSAHMVAINPSGVVGGLHRPVASVHSTHLLAKTSLACLQTCSRCVQSCKVSLQANCANVNFAAASVLHDATFNIRRCIWSTAGSRVSSPRHSTTLSAVARLPLCIDDSDFTPVASYK